MTQQSSLRHQPEYKGQDTHGEWTPTEELDFLQAYYGRLFDTLLLILHRADLLRIAQYSDNAYDLEVMQLLQQLPRLHTVQSVSTLLHHILTDTWLPYGFPITKP